MPELPRQNCAPMVASPWVDFMWAVHWTALRRWRRTRPGR